MSKENLELGEWVLEQMLGSGTFGKVMLFKHKIDGEFIAVKKCHNEINAVDDGFKAECWKKEVETLHKLKHPGIQQRIYCY